MKKKVGRWVAWLAVFVGAVSTGQAMTLGDLRGAAVLGRALNVSVLVYPGVGEQASASCLAADIVFGDLQHAKPEVTVTPVASGAVPSSLAAAPELANPVLKLGATPAPLAQSSAVPTAALAATLAAVALPASGVPHNALQQPVARIQALQGDIKALQALAIQNEANLADLQRQLLQLRQADSKPVPMAWLLLLGLLLATLAALIWALRRRQVADKDAELWWQQVPSDPTETLAVVPPSGLQSEALASAFGQTFERVVERVASTVPTAVPAVTPATMPNQPLTDIELDIDLDSLTPTDALDTAAQPLHLPPVNGTASAHNRNGDGISDIRQQAEFFVSLGQSQRAIDVLRQQILESPQPNPLVYLDLLTLYHAQGLKRDFRALRAAFQPFFNAVVPDFANFNAPSRDLLDYPEPVAVLVRFWPNREAMAFLEACIFRNNAAPMQLSFDLAAFRDLLMLHAMADSVATDSPWRTTR